MIFYNATTKQGICQKIDFICDSTDTSYSRAEKTREVNEAGKELVADLINADGKWQFDDTNNTDLPIGVGTLVASQQKYSFNAKYLQILNIKVQDNSGNWSLLKPLDQQELDYPVEELYKEDGLPEFYDKVGDTIRLFPSPSASDVTLVGGLKVEFKRDFVSFTVATDTSTDTTEPGFDIEHDILAYMASLPYLEKYKQDRVALTERKIEQKRKRLLDHYSQRDKDSVTVIETEKRAYK